MISFKYERDAGSWRAPFESEQTVRHFSYNQSPGSERRLRFTSVE